MRIDPTKTQKEATYQVVLDTLALSPCYNNAFLITVDVPEIYMHQFWFTISKIKDSSSYQFKLDNKKFRIGVEVFREILQIYPRLPNQKFVEPPSNEEIFTFIKEIGYKLESITESRPYFDFQELKSCGIDNRQTSAIRRANMPYPRFIKVIIQHFISKDKSISMRNRLFMHSIKNDSVLGRLKFVSKNEDSQVHGKMILDVMVNDATKNSKAYQIYRAFSTGAAIPKKARKGTKAANVPKKKDSFPANDNIITDDPDVALELGKSISKDTPSVSKKQNPESSIKLKGIELLSDATKLEIDTHKAVKASKRESRRQFQSRGSSEGVGIVPEVPNEPKDKLSDSSEGAGTSPENIKELEVDWLFTDKDEEDDKSIDIQETDDERTEFDNDDVEMADVTKTNADKAEEEENVEKAEEEKKEEELKGDDQDKNEQEVGPVMVTHKDKPDLHPLHEVLVSVISNPTTLPTTPAPITPPPATKTEAPIPLSSESETLTAVLQRLSAVEQEVQELKQVNQSDLIFEAIRTQVLAAVNIYLGSTLRDTLQKALQKHTEELRQELSQKDVSKTIEINQQEPQKSVTKIRKIKMEHATKQQLPKHSAKPFDQATRIEFDQKEILF
ncbi:hypothetical protein Tco_1292027 [Tanacetum coccineum]